MPSVPTPDLSPAAVARATRGDAQAREGVLAALQPILTRFFTGRLGARADVDDLVQNTLLRVHADLESLHDPARLRGFAMKAALYELHDYYRGRYSAKESLLDPDAPPPANADEAEPTARMDAEHVLSGLSPRARHILELRAYGYRYEEIAAMVESTEAAIKMQVKRAFEKLRGLMAGLALLLLAYAPFGGERG